ncbi:AAA family ATPase [uncultured Formosa sp.]|uniref:McrB family protein n=1 Tax=uncultured Formosa sp. TaxID=255435 RepID=UPI002616C89C|nr:AAA family ATPase [uncultured Formosa sp.]
MEEHINQLISEYKSYISEHGNEDEVYKWEAITHFQKHWDIDAPDFYEMFKQALAKRDNLMYKNSYGFLDKLGKNAPNRLKELCEIILKKEASFESIFKATRAKADIYLTDLKEVLKKDNFNHQLDERTISFLKVLRNPEANYLYKASVYEALCEFMDIASRNVAGEKYAHFSELGSYFETAIVKDKELMEICEAYIPKDFKFNSSKLIFQDIVYNILIVKKSENDQKAFLSRLATDLQEELESENHPLSQHQWLDNDAIRYRQISIIPNTSLISLQELHYEIFINRNRIAVEVHPEGTKDQKIAIKDFINNFGKTNNKYKLDSWRVGLSDKSFEKKEHFKIVPRQKIPFDLKSEKYDSIKDSVLNQFKELYNDFNKPLLDYLDKKNLAMHNNETSNSGYLPAINQIFYGPPGTGKTYHTVLEAAKIIEQKESLKYSEALKFFNKHLGNRIEFITFHQNYSYEDFIQGLRPDTEIGGELSFFKSDGVFKRIADRALKNLKDSENPGSAKRQFEDVFLELIKPLNDGELDELEIEMKKTSFYITEVGEKSIEFRKNQGESKHTLSINTLRKMYDSGVNTIILGGLQPYYNPILSLLLRKGKRNVQTVAKQNYVIIIDEINRANISRVFGELITLIEKDKRSHGKIPLTATLPSGDPFIVPSNLYIIGTMNTADKSIALLDIALRRRFEFKAMYPKYSIENKTIHKSEFLEKLNKLIVNSGKGHDFTIGHSYFMCDDDETFNFENTINNKVIPLMLEYYMNDENEVTRILKDADVTVGNWPLEVLPND